MNNDILAEIQRGITTAFIDKNAESSESFQPQFISNDYREKKKVLSSIEGIEGAGEKRRERPDSHDRLSELFGTECFKEASYIIKY